MILIGWITHAPQGWIAQTVLWSMDDEDHLVKEARDYLNREKYPLARVAVVDSSTNLDTAKREFSAQLVDCLARLPKARERPKKVRWAKKALI